MANSKHCIALWLVLLLLVLASCNRNPSVETTPATVLSPPTVASEAIVVATPVLAPAEWASVPLAVREYLLKVEQYTTPGLILMAPELSVDVLDRVVTSLEALAPPPEMATAHNTLLKGYRSIAEGRRLIVENVRDNLLRAEGYSLTDFGQVLLREHVQMVSSYLATWQATPVP